MVLHLLPKKSWNVYNLKNIEKVRKDEERARKEVEEIEKRTQYEDRQYTLQILRKRKKCTQNLNSNNDSQQNDLEHDKINYDAGIQAKHSKHTYTYSEKPNEEKVSGTDLRFNTDKFTKNSAKQSLNRGNELQEQDSKKYYKKKTNLWYLDKHSIDCNHSLDKSALSEDPMTNLENLFAKQNKEKKERARRELIALGELKPD